MEYIDITSDLLEDSDGIYISMGDFVIGSKFEFRKK